MNTDRTDFDVDISDTDLREPAPTTRPRPDGIRRQPWHRLVGVEIRKATDTRSGLTLIGLGVAVAAVSVAYFLIRGDAPTWSDYSGFIPLLSVIVPLIGLFSMTAEWTQRTALSTFLLSPRRGRVLFAKLVAALLLSWAVLAAVVGLIAGAVAMGAATQGVPADWSSFSSDVRGLYILMTLQVVMAAGFGALFAHTPVAVGAFLVAPTLWSLLGPMALKDNAQWLDVFEAQSRLMSDNPGALLPQTLVATSVWIVLPATIGTVRSLRREVK